MRWISLVGTVVLWSNLVQAADLPEKKTAGNPVASAIAEPPPNPAMATYNACSKAVAEWAEPYAPIAIETVITGPVERRLGGTRVARLFVRIVYDREGGPETRKEAIECTVDESGTSVALTDR